MVNYQSSIITRITINNEILFLQPMAARGLDD